MKMRNGLIVAALVGVVIASGAVFAQQRFRGRRGYSGYGPRYEPSPGEIHDRGNIPTWDVDPHFKSDLFTFVRIKYTSYGYRGGGWLTDFPDSDLNFPFRLQQLTSIKVDPQPRIIELTDDKLYDYPFIYMLEVGGLVFTEEEIAALKHYLLNGGFLMVDDFWGEEEWDNFYREIKRVFPDREPAELPLEHPIFHCVYDLKFKPQIPNINFAISHKATGETSERPWDPGSRDVHYRALFDDKGRMMAVFCHNTDLGDGWEREGEDEWFFHEFSEKRAYPMGINIVFYAMTH